MMSAFNILLPLTVLLGSVLASNTGDRTAVCTVEPTSGDPGIPIEGTVRFLQPMAGDTQISIDLSGFVTSDNETLHGFHIHQTGDLGESCKSAGGHYNPYYMNHGAPEDSVRHVGDLGNIRVDSEGEVSAIITDSEVKLSGETSVIDRAVVIHALRDDLGKGGDAESLKTGNAGARVACCVIQDNTEGVGAASARTYSVFLTVTSLLFAMAY